MNWTPGKIVGTVKPAGATVAAIPVVAFTPVPTPTILPTQMVAQISSALPVVQQPSTSETVSVNGGQQQGSISVGKLLQGTVNSSQPVGAGRIVGTVKIAGSDQPGVSSEELTKRAIDEIHRDVRINRVRASQVGALGWRQCPLKKTNKRFLSRTMSSIIQHNKRQVVRNFHSSTRKLIELDQQDELRYQRHRHWGKSETESEPVTVPDDGELEEGEVRD
ncbi:uncharacterized protein LOC131676479 [Topomyia yanbarensis]|uniref:uncharacterized protein LOC131676479 n=1 Tax=Topomyia yanbarensis TaxID=2498891 RepID=UPI00273BAF1D|nr:uncharacterized protein LOC131676479 [Topomyia yanbarensis]